jgi:hypothetical protein
MKKAEVRDCKTCPFLSARPRTFYKKGKRQDLTPFILIVNGQAMPIIL